MTAPAFFQEICKAIAKSSEPRRGAFTPAPIVFEVVVGGGYVFGGVALVRSISDAAEQFGDDSVEVAFARAHFKSQRADLVCLLDPIKILDTNTKLDAMRQAAGLITMLGEGAPIPPGAIERLLAASHHGT
jgi:hypothetical protein